MKLLSFLLSRLNFLLKTESSESMKCAPVKRCLLQLPLCALDNSIHRSPTWSVLILLTLALPPACLTGSQHLQTIVWFQGKEKARMGWSERTALKHVYYQVWNRSPVQVGCMRQVLGAGALEWPRGMGCGGRWEGGSGWGRRVNPRLIHVNVWQNPLQYCKVISLQLIKINGKKKERSNQTVLRLPGGLYWSCCLMCSRVKCGACV